MMKRAADGNRLFLCSGRLYHLYIKGTWGLIQEQTNDQLLICKLFCALGRQERKSKSLAPVPLEFGLRG